MKTHADLAEAVAFRLGLMQEGSAATGFATNRILDAYEVIHEELSEEEVAWWVYDPSEAVIPLAVFPALRDYLAAYVAGEVGADPESVPNGAVARAKLERLAVKLWNGQPTAVDRF